MSVILMFCRSTDVTRVYEGDTLLSERYHPPRGWDQGTFILELSNAPDKLEADAAMCGVRRDDEAVAGGDFELLAVPVEAEAPASDVGGLDMGMMVQLAFGARFEPERDDHQVGMVCQDLAQNALICVDDRKFFHRGLPGPDRPWCVRVHGILKY